MRRPWLWLAAAVVAVDAVALATRTPTLTSSFRRGIAHRRYRWFVLAAWFTLTSHLVIGKP